MTALNPISCSGEHRPPGADRPRLHQTATYLESQAQFGDTPWARSEPAGEFLDSAQSVADSVRVAAKGWDGAPPTTEQQPRRWCRAMLVPAQGLAKILARVGIEPATFRFSVG